MRRKNLIGILTAIVVAVSAWAFVNLSSWVAAGFAISAALTWKIPKGQKNFLKQGHNREKLISSILIS
jgi:hypothetical protein